MTDAVAMQKTDQANLEKQKTIIVGCCPSHTNKWYFKCHFLPQLISKSFLEKIAEV